MDILMMIGFDTTYLVCVGKVTTGKVLGLKTKDRHESPGTILLGEDGLPAGLALAVLFGLSLLEFSPEDLNALINVGVGAEQLDDSLASVGLTTLLHEPDGALREERHSDEEESGHREGHDKSESERPLAMDLGGTEAGHRRSEEAEDDDDVGERRCGTAKVCRCVLGDVERRDGSRETDGETKQELRDKEDWKVGCEDQGEG
jgi:hypothetical protein